MPVSGVSSLGDIAKSPPVLGLPVVGQLLNVPNEIAANLALDLTDPNSPVVGTAQQEGAQASLAQRTDISPLGKTALDLGTSFATPGFGFVGPASEITAGVTKPAVDLISKVFNLAPNLPLIGKLFDAAPSAQLNQMSEEFGTALGRVNRNGVDPTTFQSVMDGYNAGTVSAQQAKDELGVGQLTFNSLAAGYNNVTPGTFPFDATTTDAQGWYRGLGQTAVKNYATQLGITNPSSTAQILPQPLQSTLQKVNTVSREIQLSTGHVGGVILVDQGGKAFVNNLLQYLPGDIADLAKNRSASGLISPLRDFFGPGATIDNSLAKSGQVNAVSGILGLEPSQGVIGGLSTPQAAAGGAAIGALGGGPVGAALGAAQGVATKAGLGVNNSLAQFADTVTRQRFIASGITKYFENDPLILETYTPTLRDAGLEQVQQLAGPASDTLFNQVQAKNFWIDPASVGKLAQADGVSPQNAQQITSVWRDLNDEAETAAISFMRQSNLVFNRDTNLLSYVRNVTPFPIWPFQNAPYYFKTAVRYPGVATAITDTHATEAQNRTDQNLTQKVDNKIPILTIGGQTIYANPINFLSASSQFVEPYQAPSDQPQTVVDKALSIANSIGISPFLYQEAAAQAAGIAGQGQDFPTLSPFSRLTNALGTAITGAPFNIESGLTAPLQAVRQAVAPDSIPAVPYAVYQIRQTLADMALTNTGKPWYQDPEYEQAMIDPSSDLYKQAATQTGITNALLFPLKKYVPFQVNSVGTTEQQVRDQKGQVTQALQGSTLPSTDQFAVRDQFPTSEGYQYIGEPTPQMILHLKLNTYYGLPKASQPLYAKMNPDLQAYQLWSAQQKQTGAKDTSVATYLKVKNATPNG